MSTQELTADMQRLVLDSVVTFYFSKNRRLYNCRRIKKRVVIKLEINEQKNFEAVKPFSMEERILLERITTKNL